MTTTQEKINAKLKELFTDTSFDCYQYTDFDSADELMDAMREEILQDEVIYYSSAMQYLMENDNSLHESMALAHDMGYTADNITSELLATILKQQNLGEELNDLSSEIEECFNESES